MIRSSSPTSNRLRATAFPRKCVRLIVPPFPADAPRIEQGPTKGWRSQLADPNLDQLPRKIRPRPRPRADLSAAAVDARRQAARQDVPAEEAVVARRARQCRRVAGENFIADGSQAFAENLADVGVAAGAADDRAHRVFVNVADRELVEVGGEAAAGFDFAFWVDDQGLAGAFAVILFKPDAVPAAGEALGALDGGEVVPVQRHGHIGGDEQIAAQHVGPFDDAVKLARECVNRLEPLIRAAARVRDRDDVVAAKLAAGSAAEIGKHVGLDAVELVDAEADLAR